MAKSEAQLLSELPTNNDVMLRPTTGSGRAVVATGAGTSALLPLVPCLNLFLGAWPNCTIRSPVDFRSFTQPDSVGTSVTCLDAGTVFKRYVLCPHCKEDYIFTLQDAHNQN